MEKMNREKREDVALRKRWMEKHGWDLGQPYMEWYNENVIKKATDAGNKISHFKD
jgi:hypothetical protein